MPYINIKITKDSINPEQKANLVEGLRNLLQEILGKNHVTTVMAIDEVDMDYWGIAGDTMKKNHWSAD